MNDELFQALLMFSALIESIVEQIKTNDTLRPYARVLAVVLGLAIALILQFDVIPALALPISPVLKDIPLIGFVFTGLLLGAGSHVLHSFLDFFRAGMMKARSLRDQI